MENEQIFGGLSHRTYPFICVNSSSQNWESGAGISRNMSTAFWYRFHKEINSPWELQEDVPLTFKKGWYENIEEFAQGVPGASILHRLRYRLDKDISRNWSSKAANFAHIILIFSITKYRNQFACQVLEIPEILENRRSSNMVRFWMKAIGKPQQYTPPVHRLPNAHMHFTHRHTRN